MQENEKVAFEAALAAQKVDKAIVEDKEEPINEEEEDI